jgi:hypothetical protein
MPGDFSGSKLGVECQRLLWRYHDAREKGHADEAARLWKRFVQARDGLAGLEALRERLKSSGPPTGSR